jgi:Uma2 family endonuclease
MAGETRDYNQIVQNVGFALRQHLRRGPCKLYLSDIRVNFDLRNDEYYYYPDLVVTCDKRDTHPRFVRHPKLIIEVLSENTERIDKREKFFACTSIPSLEEYVLIAQAKPEIDVFRRSGDWKAERISGGRSKALLHSLRLSCRFRSFTKVFRPEIRGLESMTRKRAGHTTCPVAGAHLCSPPWSLCDFRM